MALDFDLPPIAYDYRPLRKRRNRMRGWDVVALQSGLLGLGLALPRAGADGVFGVETDRAVRDLQESAGGLAVDGIAGIATQTRIGHDLALKAAKRRDLPAGCPLGHVEKESGFQLGNHTAIYQSGAATWSRDNGAVQMNDRFYPEVVAYDTPRAIAFCAGRVTEKRDLYLSWGEVSDERALELACGSWNAPSWTDTLAKGDDLPAYALEAIEGYIDRVTVYL